MRLNGMDNYIPVASVNTLGIASFYEDCFDVINGKAYIKRTYVQHIAEDYCKAQLKLLKFSTELVDDKLISILTDSNNELITGSAVNLPFNDYVTDLQLRKNGDDVTLTAYNRGNIINTQNVSFDNYAKNDSLTKYGNNLSVTLDGNNLTFSLLNDSNSLKSSTVNLSEYAKNINVTRSGDTVTFKVLNGNNVISTTDFNITDSLSLKDCKLDLRLDTSNYILTAYLKDKYGSTITSASVDFPLESVVVGAEEYDGTIVLTLQNGSTTSFYIGDLVEGLVSQHNFDEATNLVLNELVKVELALDGYVNDIYALLGEGFV